MLKHVVILLSLGFILSLSLLVYYQRHHPPKWSEICVSYKLDTTMKTPINRDRSLTYVKKPIYICEEYEYICTWGTSYVGEKKCPRQEN